MHIGRELKRQERGSASIDIVLVDVDYAAVITGGRIEHQKAVNGNVDVVMLSDQLLPSLQGSLASPSGLSGVELGGPILDEPCRCGSLDVGLLALTKQKEVQEETIQEK